MWMRSPLLKQVQNRSDLAALVTGILNLFTKNLYSKGVLGYPNLSNPITLGRCNFLKIMYVTKNKE